MTLLSRHAIAGGGLFVALAVLPQLPLANLGIPANLLTELLILSILALGLNVILGTDRDRLDLTLRSHHVLQRGAKLDGKPSVGH